MQLDSILSDQLSSSTIQPTEPALHTSAPSDLDCSHAFEASLPPYFESIVTDKLSRVSSSTSNTSSSLSSKLDTNKRDNKGNSRDGSGNEGTAESTVCQQSLLLSMQNDAVPLDHKASTDPTRLQEQEQPPQQQQQERHPHQQHLVLLKMCSYPGSASLTPLSAEDPSLAEQSSPETASLFNHRGADSTRREQERLLSEPQFSGVKDLESILKGPSLAQHPHIIYPACLSTTTTDHGSSNAPASTGSVDEDRLTGRDQTPQNPVPPQLPSHQQAPAPTGAPYAHTHADTSVEESTVNNSSHVSLDTCAFFSAQSSVRTFSTSIPSSPNQMTKSKKASKAKVVRQSTTLSGSGKVLHVRCDSDYMSDDMIDALAIGAEKKRPTAAESETNMLKKRKRSKGQDKAKSRISISAGTTTHLLQFLEKRLGRSSWTIPSGKTWPGSSGHFAKTEPVPAFDPSTLVRLWSIPRSRNGSPCTTVPQRASRFRSWDDQHSSSHVCNQQHTSVEHCQCRKRFFADAIELASPFGMNALTGDQYPGWIDSIKKRKIHQFATKWTSTLSPSPYLKLLTVRNFWDVMSSRLDLSWLDERKIQGKHMEQSSEEGSRELPDIENHGASKGIIRLRREHEQYLSSKEDGKDGRIVRQYPCPTPFLKGLWEEELREQRVRQMIPDTVRRPPRNRIFNSRPIASTAKPTKPCLPSLLTPSLSTRSEINAGSSTDACDSTASMGSDAATTNSSSQPVLAELDLMLKKKHRATAIVRSHAIAEGSDMSDYKPWKDGTVVPHRGSLCSLKELRSNIMDPWPTEETRSRDECSRILHRMREQLNVVINLQIHLRSMIKTAPTQLSFLLSIRHPAQVSIELLLALYGPHFTQTSNFRAIEQLLWGSHGHSQPQPQADTSSSGSLLHV